MNPHPAQCIPCLRPPNPAGHWQGRLGCSTTTPQQGPRTPTQQTACSERCRAWKASRERPCLAMAWLMVAAGVPRPARAMAGSSCRAASLLPAWPPLEAADPSSSQAAVTWARCSCCLLRLGTDLHTHWQIIDTITALCWVGAEELHSHQTPGFKWKLGGLAADAVSACRQGLRRKGESSTRAAACRLEWTA